MKTEGRIAFLRTGRPVYGHDWVASHTTSVDPPEPRSAADVRDFTGGQNLGNYVHWAAMPALIDRRRYDASFLHLNPLVEALGVSDAARFIDRRFDFVCVSTANFIQRNVSMGPLCDVLAEVRAKILLVGAGLQRGDVKLADLSEDVVRLLEVVDEKALVFGTRGESTSAWLQAQGFSRARALGCPSVFAGLDGIGSLSWVEPAAARRVVTSGHMKVGGPGERFEALVSLLERSVSGTWHYVMQSELSSVPSERAAARILDARNAVDSSFVGKVFFRGGRRPPSAMDFWCFIQPHAWRQFASGADLYVGDRVHGSILCMQAGIPAVLLHADERAHEIADFFAMPSLSLDDAKRGRELEDVYHAAALDRMRGAVAQRFRVFVGVLEDAGVAVAPSVREALSGLG